MNIDFLQNGSVYFTVEIQGKNQHFNFPISNPEGETVQELTGKTEEFFKCEVLKNMYGTFCPAYNKGLDEWTKWINDGCWAERATLGGVMTKYQITPRNMPEHPKKKRIIDGEKIGDVTMKEWEAAETVGDLKTVLMEIFKGRK